MLTVLKSALEHWQASVAAFIKPKDTLAEFAKQPDAFDIVVTDIKMSVMTSFELASNVWNLERYHALCFSFRWSKGSILLDCARTAFGYFKLYLIKQRIVDFCLCQN